MIKCFRPSRPKESKEKNPISRFNVNYALPINTPFIVFIREDII